MLIALFPLALAAPPAAPLPTGARSTSAAPPVASEAGADDTAGGAPPEAPVIMATVDSAAHTASSAKLLGAACSYTTGLMARHVLEDGTDWATRSALLPAVSDADARVATPFTVEGDASVHLIATELLEALTNDPVSGTTVNLGGRMMEVDGVRYVVLTSYQGYAPAP